MKMQKKRRENHCALTYKMGSSFYNVLRDLFHISHGSYLLYREVKRENCIFFLAKRWKITSSAVHFNQFLFLFLIFNYAMLFDASINDAKSFYYAITCRFNAFLPAFNYKMI